MTILTKVQTNGVDFSGSTDLNIDGGTLFVDATNNRVGVGTTSPTYLCNVLAASGSQNIFQAGQTGVSNGYTITSNGTNLTHAWFNGGSETARIDSSGRLGIGTSAPGYQLEVGSGATDATALFNSTAGTGSHIRFGRSGTVDGYFGCATGFLTSGTSAGDIGIRSQGALVLSSGGNNNRIFIASAGNVGIGATPSAKLHVNTGTNENLWVGSLGGSGAGVYLASVNDSGSANTPLQIGSASDIRLAISGTEAARIDSSRRLLVGTSSTSRTTLVQIVQANETATSGQSNLGIFTSNAQAADVGAKIALGGQSGEANWLYASLSGRSENNGYAGYLQFGTSDAAGNHNERMRITQNGNVRIGGTTTVNNERFLVVADGTYAGGTFYQPITGSYTAVAFNNPNGVVGTIATSGVATAYNTSSDYRLKENVAQVADGIARLQQLKPSRFNFIADPGKTVDGFIAHEVQTIVPEAITGEKDAVDEEGNPVYQGIDQSKLVPLLTAALQEAVAKIESLEARLTAAGI